jgi:hypothetical protein
MTRPNDDHYRSPPECARALLSVESVPGGAWDSCAGDGILAAALAETLGLCAVHASTIDVPEDVYHPVHQADFLECRSLIKPHIVINPPYGYLHGQRLGRARAATILITHALDMLERAGPTGGKLCALVDLRYRLSEERNSPAGLFSTRPPARIHAFADRVSMFPARWDNLPQNGGTIPFAWFVWEYPFHRPGYQTPILVDLDSRAFRRPDDERRFDLRRPTRRGRAAA